MPAWEYHIIHPNQMRPKLKTNPGDWKSNFERYLQERGEEGWEFCGYDPAENAIFKRPVQFVSGSHANAV